MPRNAMNYYEPELPVRKDLFDGSMWRISGLRGGENLLPGRGWLRDSAAIASTLWLCCLLVN